ncbi:uncharacterized protein LOC143916699 [Arctopsyche grandis]|uniref:uncharacterized protein LOC143916699 n=1 Tax=Arctopsyche grandis TaxID=121162 RepID=UPI00406D92A5
MFFGGTKDSTVPVNEVVVFDLATKTTSYLPSMGKSRKDVKIAEIDGYIYVIGGVASEFSTFDKEGLDLQVYDVVERYEPKSNRWTTMAPMLTKRRNHAVNTWEGKIYVAGGINQDSQILNSLEIYDPKLNKWTMGQPMQCRRFSFPIVFYDGALFAFGYEVPGERLDLITQKWSNLSNTQDWRTAVVYDDKIIMGGVVDSTYEFNPKTNQLKQLNFKKIIRSSESFLVPKALVSIFPPKESTKSITDYPITIVALGPSLPLTNICTIEFYHPLEDSWAILSKIELNVTKEYSAIYSDKKIFIFGGINRTTSTTGKIAYSHCDEVISFDLLTKEISKLTPMGQKKENVGVGKIGEYIYISGGKGINGTIYDTVERYDPKEDAWTFMAPMLTKRYNHAVNVWEGKMYVAGGNDYGYYNLLSLEIYDPNLNQWTLGTSMKSKRTKFSILFMDGSLFAMGGNYWRGDDYHKNHGEKLDLKTQTWTDIENPIRDSLWRSAVPFDDKIIIYGDEHQNYEYNPETNELKEKNPNKVNRFSAILLLAPMI